MESRRASKSSLREDWWDNRRFSGSFSSEPAGICADLAHDALDRIRLSNRRVDHPSSINEWAKWSSNSGWVGGSPRLPKSPGVRTRPSPKQVIQTRLTQTRAKSGCCAWVMVSANSRRPEPEVIGIDLPILGGMIRAASGPGRRGLPRRYIRPGLGSGVSTKAWALGGAPLPSIRHCSTFFRKSCKTA